MRVTGLDLIKPELAKKIEVLYGPLSIGPDGQPLEAWESRNIRKVRLGIQFRHSAFPDYWLKFIGVNRRMVRAITSVYSEAAARWTVEYQRAHGLNVFQKCYCFGDGEEPSLFWYGAAWQLPLVLKGEPLRELQKIFVRHGFTPLPDNERILEFW